MAEPNFFKKLLKGVTPSEEQKEDFLEGRELSERFFDVYEKEGYFRAKQLLEDVGLERRANHKPSQLSGGGAQRTGIAVALANDPEIVLADEPTGELDSVTTLKIIDYFKLLNKNLGKTFFVVTHDHRFANMTKKAMRIIDGRIVGLHRAIDPAKSLSLREEVIYVDDHGNLRLPDEIRRQAGIKNHIQIEMRDGFATLIPVRGEITNE